MISYTHEDEITCVTTYCTERKVSKITNITSDLIRGHTEIIILKQLLRADSYGYEINRNINKTTENQYELKEATLYSAFRRLEAAGHISSYWGDEDSGARRRYYTITETGIDYYTGAKAEWEQSKKIIDKLI